MAFESAFLQAFVYLAAALAAVLLGKMSRLGAVLGYLAVGAAIGPWGLHLTGHDSGSVTHFAEFGVVVMLFLIGLELHPSMLWRMRQQVFGLGSAQVVLTLAAIAALLSGWAGMGWKPALAAGMILSLSSTAIVLQTLSEKGILRTQAGQDSFAVLLFQDLAAIPMLAFLPQLGTAGTGGHPAQAPAWLAGVPAWAHPLLMLAVVALLVVAARAGFRPVFRMVARTGQREAFTAAALLMVIGVALLMTRVGLSPALGAFVAGMVLANSEYRHELETDLEPFKGLLLGLFFMGVGADIDFGYVGRHWPLVLGGTATLFAVKGLLLVVISKIRRNTWRSAFMFGASLSAGGEFAFVLLSIAGSASVLPGETGRALSAIVALSMAATPLLIEAVRRTLTCSAAPGAGAGTDESDVADEGHAVIICGFGRFGHAVGRLLTLRGHSCTVLDRDTDYVETLRTYGIPVFFGDAGRPDLLATAGAARAKVLVVALRDPVTTLRIVETCKKHFPHLRLYLRAWSRTEAYEYLAAGEERVYRDTIDSSLRMAVDILRDEFAMPGAEAERAASRYRAGDEQFVRDVARFRNDEKAFTNATREAVRSLEELLGKDAGADDDIIPARATEGTDDRRG